MTQQRKISRWRFVGSSEAKPPVTFSMFSGRMLSESAKNRLRQMSRENQEKDDQDNESHNPTV